jgi:hypothetical protein
VAINHDGTVAMSGSRDGLLFKWDLSIESWRSTACRMVGRNLDASEWAQYLPGHTPTPTCPQVSVREADAAALKGDKLRAAKLFEEASRATIAQADALLMNDVCWYGSLDRLAASVWRACEAAVEHAPDDERGFFVDTRGIARALRGDYVGAIRDFRAFLAWSKEHDYDNDEAMARRREWVNALADGRNPFSTETLDELRSETVNVR